MHFSTLVVRVLASLVFARFGWMRAAGLALGLAAQAYAVSIGNATITAPTTASLTTTTVTLGGNVTSDGGNPLTERGVVYAVTATNAAPQISGTGVTKVVAAGTTTGTFTVNVTGLAPGTAYTFAAYAKNSSSTVYTTATGFITPASGTTGLAGSSLPFDNTQPTLGIRWVIFTEGIFPQRSENGYGLGGGSQPFIGEVRPVAMVTATPDRGWVECNGQILAISSNPALFSLLGTYYGGNGTSTFGLPDLRGRVPVGVGTTSGGVTYTLGQTGGSESISLTTNELPAHTHTLTFGATGSAGGGQAFDHTQPWLALTTGVLSGGVYGREIGWVRFYAFNFLPVGGGIACDGRVLPIGEYEVLFNLIGTTYGGNGVDNFAVPDLRGRSPLGIGGTANHVLGEAIGTQNLTLPGLNLPAHTHTITGGATGSTGSGQAVSNLQPSLGLNWVMATAGIFNGFGDEPALGELRVWAPSQLPDRGWTSATGGTLAINQNQALFYLLGTTFGGNGSTTFLVPDLRGRIAAHPGGTRAVGNTWGSESITLTAAQMPAHAHTYNVAITAPTVTTPTSASVLATSATLGGNITSDGGITLTERGILYALTSANAAPQLGGTGVTKVAATGTATGIFTAAVTGLTSDSNYSYVAYAISPGGTAYTTVDTFRTPLPGTLEILSRKDPAAAGYATSQTGNATTGNTALSFALSETGRYVAFVSSATNLVPNQTGTTTTNLYYRDRTANTTKLISGLAGSATAGAGGTTVVFMSNDGRYVTFTSTATGLLATATTGTQLFLYDRDANSGAGAVSLVSHATGAPTTAGNGNLVSQFLARDGRTIAFTSAATNLLPTATTGTQMFRYDIATGTLTLASPKTDSSTVGVGTAVTARGLSDDGRWVVFFTAATDAVANFVGSGSHMYLFDSQTGTTRLVDRAVGTTATASSAAVAGLANISADGRYVAFVSPSTDLVSGYTGTGSQVYLYDRVADTVKLISRSTAGATVGGTGASALGAITNGVPSLSVDGRFIAIASAATDLIAGYSGTGTQLYLYDRLGNAGAGSLTLVTRTAASATTGSTGLQTASVVLSPDGSRVVFGSTSSDLPVTVIPNSTFAGIYAYTTTTGAYTLVNGSAGNRAAFGNATSSVPWASADGTLIGLASAATDLAASDNNGFFDIFGSVQSPVTIAPEINSTAAVSGQTGSVFSYSIRVTHPATSYSYTGTIPAGLTFDPATGVFGGTPTAAGTTTLTLKATNTAGDSPTFALAITLTLGGSVPTLSLPTSASILATTATLGGTLNTDGNATITERGVVYALTSANAAPQLNGTGVTKVAATGTATGVFATPVTSLTAGSGYSYAAYATNAIGTGYSAVDTFTTFAVPTVTGVSPSAGPTGGGTTVTITGTALTGATAVTFGATPATVFTVNSATQITATAPAGTSTVDIRVTTAGGTSATSAADQFTYVPAPTITSISPTAGPVTGSTTVTLTGTGFTGTTAVTFGATPATTFTVNSATQITATAPAGTGTVDVRVTTAGGTSATSTADQFTFVPAPTVASVGVPSSGTAKLGATLDFTVNWSAAVNVVTTGGTPTLGLTIGSTARTASYVSGTGTTATVFRYTVQSTDLDTDGLAVGALALNGGTIKDTYLTNAVLTLNSVGSTAALKVDGVVPTLSSVAITSSNTLATRARTGEVITLSFTASETISAPTVSLATHTVTATNTSGNAWSATFTMLVTDTEGTIPFSIAFADLTGNAGTTSTATTNSSSVIFDRTAPTVTAANVALTGASGTGGAFKIGDTVTVTWNNSATGNNNTDVASVTVGLTQFGGTATMTNTAGLWSGSFVIAAGSIDGTNRNVSLNVSDTTGNTALFTGTHNATVDNIAPVVTAARISLSGATGVSGVYKIGDTVTATWNSTATGDNNADIATATLNFSSFGGGSAVTATNASGTWTATYTLVAGSIEASNLNVSVTATDDAGNVATTSGTNNATVDNIAPAAPSTPDLADASDSGSSSTDNLTKITTPVFTGTAVAGATVKLYDTDGTTLLGSATATGGNWSITSSMLTVGNHTVTAKATDTAGNTGVASGGLTLVIDNVAPTAPVILGIADDTGASATDGVTTDTTIILNGTAEAGSTVTLSKGGNVIGTATANGSGAWTFDYTGTVLAGGDHSFTATATDAAGNVSNTSATYLVSIDTTTPAVPVISAITTDTGSSATDGITKDNTLVLSGTAEANSTVTVLRNGVGSIGTATTNGSGAWSFDYTGTTLVDGTYLFTATATDRAGNTSAASGDFPVVVDTVAPAAPSTPVLAAGSDSGNSATDKITNITTPTLTGTAEAGSFVQLYRDVSGTPTLVASTTATAGAWSITVPTALSHGAHVFTATATDAAGNAGVASASLTINVDTTVPTFTSAVTTGGTYNSAFSFTLTASDAGGDWGYRSFTATGLPTGLGIDATTGAITGTPTQSGPFTVALTVTDLAGNVGTGSLAITIAKATPVITWSTPTGITYGTALSATQLNATASVGGAFVYTPVLASVPLAGTQTLSVAFTPTDTANYNSVPVTTVSLAVAQAPVTITGLATTPRVYDGTLVAAITGSGTLNGIRPADTANVSIAGTATGVFADKNVGTKSVAVNGLSLTGSASGNYVLTPPTSTGSITAKTVTVTGITANSRVYNGTTTATLNLGSAAPAGVVSPDVVTVVTTGATGTFANANAGFSKTVAITGLTLGGAGAGNYTILTQPTTTADITPAGAAIAISNLSFTYDGTPKSATITITPAVAASIVYSNGGTPPTNGGTYTVSVNVTDGNYSGSATATLTIAKAAQTVSFSAPAGTPLLNTPITLTATASSGLPVTFSLVSGAATLSGSSVTLTAAGATVIRATQAGNDNYLVATADSTLTAAAKLAQTITFAPLANKKVGDPSITLAAVASSGLPVAYSVSGPATLSGSTLILNGSPGAVFVTASQAGNGAFNAATSVTQSFDVITLGHSIFFGVTQNNDTIALDVSPDGKKGTIICFIDGEAFFLEFTINADGTFDATVSSLNAVTEPGARIASTDALREGGGNARSAAEATVAATTTRTFRGKVVNGVLTGSVVELGVSFSANVQSTVGSTAAVAGFYQAAATNTSSGNAYTVVGTQGEVFTVAVTPTTVAAGKGTLGDGNSFNITSGKVTLAGALDQGTSTITGNIIQAGQVTVPFTGASLAVVRTDRLINLSSRVRIAPAAGRTLITGFVIGGTNAKRVLLRAVGPGLTGFGVTGALVNPKLQLFDASGKVLLENDDWSGAETAAAFTQVGAFALTAGTKDAALLATLAPGAYSMQVTAGAESGTALAEIYDASTSASTDSQRLVNISTRGTVDVGTDGLLIGGFVVTGNTPKKVLIRGIGPGLTAFGVAGALVDPRLAIYSGSTVVAQNDDWSAPIPINAQQTAATAAEISTAAVNVGAFTLGANSKDAAVLVTLAPGAYTAQVTGAAGQTGVALVEVYEVP